MTEDSLDFAGDPEFRFAVATFIFSLDRTIWVSYSASWRSDDEEARCLRTE